MKDKLLHQKAFIGSWVQIASPTVCEIFARMGLDWFGIDMEHTEMEYETVAHMLRGVKNTDTAPFIRVRSNNALDIRRGLDIGAKGIIVPLIHNKEEAQKAVSYCKYPPEGVRGHAFCRANNWGIDFSSYAKKANRDTAVFVMIESKEGVMNIDDILQTKGLDGVFIGPYDMSASYGITGDTSNPLIINACEKVVKACQKHHKIAGMHIVKGDRESIETTINQGFSFIAVGIDALFITEKTEEIIDIAKKMK